MNNKWSTIKLSVISDFQGGSQPPKSQFVAEPKDGYVRLLQIRDFKSDDKAVYIPEAKKNRQCRSNDIMIGRYGASVGQIHRGKSGAYNVALIKTIPDENKIRKDFFYHYLVSDLFQRPLFSVSDRSAQAGFSKDDIADFEVPLPSLNEQKRIVTILDEAFEGIAAATANAAQNLKNARELFETYLKKTFSERGEGWEEKRLYEICTFSSGGTPSKKNENYWAGEIPWVSGRDMKSTRLSDSHLHISRTAVEESATRLAPVGTLLILVRGMGLAHGAQIAELMAPCAFNQDIKGVNPDSCIVPRYLLFALRDQINWSDSVLSNAAHGTLKIDTKELTNLIIPVPPFAHQQRVVAAIDLLKEKTANLEAIYQKKLNALTELKQSLLQKAFAGELH